MNEMKREQTVRFFAEQIKTCQSCAETLRADGREDEAVFAKVQANVYDIFRTVFNVAVETAGQDDRKAVQFFLIRLRQIPQSWHTSLANAQQHGQIQKAHIEHVKLDTVEEIQKKFEEIWEGIT